MSNLVYTWSLEKARAERKALEPLFYKVATSERNKAIAVSILRGASYSAAAREHGIGAQRAGQIFYKTLWAADHIRNGRFSEMQVLLWPNVRISNMLKHEGINTLSAARAAWDEKGQDYFLTIPNFGRNSLKVLADTLGVAIEPPQEKPISRSRYEAAKRLVRRYEEQNGSGT